MSETEELWVNTIESAECMLLPYKALMGQLCQRLLPIQTYLVPSHRIIAMLYLLIIFQIIIYSNKLFVFFGKICSLCKTFMEKG